MYKFELHAHTSDCDKMAEVSGADLVKAYHNAGYSGMVITDHYASFFLEWFGDEFDINNHKTVIDRYLRGYFSARNEGEKIGFTVLCGAEVRLDGDPNDYLVYGLEEDDFYNLPLLNSLPNVEALSYVLPKSAVIVQAHPFRNNMRVCSPDAFFGIETHNGGTELFRNEMAREYARCYKKKMTSGSDTHSMDAVGLGGIMTGEKIESSPQLVSVLRSGEYSLIENYKKKKR